MARLWLSAGLVIKTLKFLPAMPIKQCNFNFSHHTSGVQTMDTSAIAALATNMHQARTTEDVQLAVLKKALDSNARSGIQLIQAASQSAPRYPPHLGSLIDTIA
jgi:hypothetical protein